MDENVFLVQTTGVKKSMMVQTFQRREFFRTIETFQNEFRIVFDRSRLMLSDQMIFQRRDFFLTIKTLKTNRTSFSSIDSFSFYLDEFFTRLLMRTSNVSIEILFVRKRFRTVFERTRKSVETRNRKKQQRDFSSNAKRNELRCRFVARRMSCSIMSINVVLTRISLSASTTFERIFFLVMKGNVIFQFTRPSKCFVAKRTPMNHFRFVLNVKKIRLKPVFQMFLVRPIRIVFLSTNQIRSVSHVVRTEKTRQAKSFLVEARSKSQWSTYLFEHRQKDKYRGIEKKTIFFRKEKRNDGSCRRRQFIE